MHRSQKIALVAASAFIASTTSISHADVVATLKDPVLKTGAGSIDPTGNETVNSAATVTGVNVLTPMTALTARSDLRVIQTFTTANASNGIIPKNSPGIGGTSNTEVICFTNAALPAIRFSVADDINGVGGSGTSTGANMGYYQRTTSDESAIILQGQKNPYTFTFTVAFGAYDESTKAFTTGVNSVDAAGFTISNVTNNINLTVRFLDSSGGILTEQKATGASSDGDTNNFGGPDFYFGYQTPDQSYKIASIAIIVSCSSTVGNDVSMGLDDLALTTIPEPAAAGLLGVGGTALILSRKSGSRR